MPLIIHIFIPFSLLRLAFSFIWFRSLLLKVPFAFMGSLLCFPKWLELHYEKALMETGYTGFCSFSFMLYFCVLVIMFQTYSALAVILEVFQKKCLCFMHLYSHSNFGGWSIDSQNKLLVTWTLCGYCCFYCIWLFLFFPFLSFFFFFFLIGSLRIWPEK